MCVCVTAVVHVCMCIRQPSLCLRLLARILRTKWVGHGAVESVATAVVAAMLVAVVVVVVVVVAVVVVVVVVVVAVVVVAAAAAVDVVVL